MPGRKEASDRAHMKGVTLYVDGIADSAPSRARQQSGPPAPCGQQYSTAHMTCQPVSIRFTAFFRHFPAQMTHVLSNSRILPDSMVLTVCHAVSHIHSVRPRPPRPAADRNAGRFLSDVTRLCAVMSRQNRQKAGSRLCSGVRIISNPCNPHRNFLFCRGGFHPNFTLIFRGFIHF